ncbi:hypothetical protein [Streptomyces sp. NPDC002573]|uniref:hypothetical protein n=1 Tax=Streptomyces sp. NPDC002573 TaxID=3364651 RepID=UPI003687032F
MTRLTTERVTRFLQALSQPKTTVFAAAAAAGVTQAAIYQRRSRDPEFAEAMDAARDAGSAPVELRMPVVWCRVRISVVRCRLCGTGVLRGGLEARRLSARWGLQAAVALHALPAQA